VQREYSWRVRPGLPEDAVLLCELERAVTDHPWSLAQMITACRSDRERVLVMEAGGCVLAYAVYHVVLDEATLLNIVVAKAAQGRGTGRQLLDALLILLRGATVCRLLLEVRQSNLSALTLYRRMGFIEDGVRRNYYPAASGRENAILMSLNLEMKA
jgi:ribosomal-protein-alanine N-acetyltransferase